MSTVFNPRDFAIRAQEQDSISSATSPPTSFRGPLERPLPEPVARVDSTALMAEVLGYLLQVADALERLHRTGAVHGNLRPKPSNIVASDRIAGVARYISPERVRGLVLDARHDLYCLGVIAWEMLTGGRPLFTGRSATAVMCRHLSAPVPQLPLELIRFQPVLERLLAKERQDRYSSARELTNDLQARFSDVIATPGGNVKPLDDARAA